MTGVVERVVGAPVVFEELKHKPGRRLTLRARGPERSVIVKLYHSDRVLTVAERIAALGDGPAEPVVPAIVALDVAQRLLVLSEVRGVPLREAVLASDDNGCRRAGAAIAGWHVAWAGKRPGPLREHTVERELGLLVDRAAGASDEISRRVATAVAELGEAWLPVTVVHRDLYEDQVLLGERVGLIDIDDAALGPPELDVGNLLAHVDLLELDSGRDLGRSREALLAGYAAQAEVDLALLERCRTLARLRLACIHAEPRLTSARAALAGVGGLVSAHS